MHLITEDPITPEIAAKIEAMHQSAETSVTVTAQVIGSTSSIATSTPDLGFWHSIIQWILNLI